MKSSEVIATRPTKVIYRDGEKAIKVFEPAHKPSDVLRESLNLALVSESGFCVPGLREIIRLEDKWAIVMDYIEGETMESLMRKNPERIDEYMERFVDIQLDMHRYSGIGLKNMHEKMHGKIRTSGLDATTRYDLHARLDSIEQHQKLCHGDFNPSNVIITPENKACVLDWSHAMCGNASADAAKTYMMFCLSGDETLAEKYINLFCKKSDTARQYVEKWLSILAASRLGKNKEEEREFLQRWANVVDWQ